MCGPETLLEPPQNAISGLDCRIADVIPDDGPSNATRGTMVLVLDANSEIGAHVESNLQFDLFKAFDIIESRYKAVFFSP